MCIRDSHRGALPGLAAALAASVDRRPAVVTWAPTTADRRRSRGFDHAQLLAAAVSRHLRLPCRPLLVRAAGPPQTGQPLARRRLGPRFDAPGPVPAHVLVVDDVVTSGATVAAAARALRAGGAALVDVLAAARGQHASADEVARAILGGPGQHTAPPAYTGSVAHGSVVASRCQSQAKRPT